MTDLARKLYEAACTQTFAPMIPWDRVDRAHQATWEAIASVAESALCGSDAATAGARCHALADVAAELLTAVEAERADRKDFEFSTSEAQQRKRRTTRLLGKVKAAIEEARR